MYAVFATAIFIGAFLLFLVQPLLARQLLPAVGGAASVWNACMLFFQGALLVGYGYAHGITRLSSKRAQVGLHLILVLAACALLPIRIPAASEAAGAHPIWWLLSTLGTSVGTPFVLVAATSPLVQRWFSQSAHRNADDPYFLYAAGNLGSLVALIGYPILIEPLLSLPRQHAAWAVGYGLLACTLIAAAVLTRGPRAANSPPRNRTVDASDKETPEAIRRWLALAFIPSSLTLGVTSHITADLGSAPLLWTLPLGLYLLSFILAFSNRAGVKSERVLAGLSGLALFASATSGQALETVPIGLAIALHLAAFFVVALTCHARLAEIRPGPHRLTAFYLWIAVGGFLGGVFNTLVAPLLFSWPWEYPLVLALACLLRLGSSTPATRSIWRSRGMWTLGFTIAAFGWVLIARHLIATRGLDHAYAWFNIPILLLALFALRQPVAFAALIAIIPIAGMQLESAARRQDVSRGFFGVHRVLATADRAVYRNGTTIHGMQSLSQDRCVPLAYYHPASPVARAIAALQSRKPIRHAGLIGLGVGSLAPYARPGEAWQFFEIDPEVERIARDRRFFTFISDCVAPGAGVTVRIVDGRLALAGAGDGYFDLVVVDAFSSDVIPMHLVTREALALYKRRLSDGGVLLFHVSNRHFDLRPLLARLGDSVGMDVLMGHDVQTEDEEEARGRLSSTWIAMTAATTAATPAANPRSRRLLLDHAGFHALSAQPNGPLWTDQQASLLSVIRFDAFWGN